MKKAMVIFIMLFGMQGVETRAGYFKKRGIFSECLWETTVESKALWGPALLFLPSGHFNFAFPVSSYPWILTAGACCNLQARSQSKQRDQFC